MHRGTPGVETLPFAAELPGEQVVTKQSFDGFLGTDLDEVLAGRGIRGLLIAGLVTSTCVLFTAAIGDPARIPGVGPDGLLLRPRRSAPGDAGDVPVRVRHVAL